MSIQNVQGGREGNRSLGGQHQFLAKQWKNDKDSVDKKMKEKGLLSLVNMIYEKQASSNIFDFLLTVTVDKSKYIMDFVKHLIYYK